MPASPEAIHKSKRFRIEYLTNLAVRNALGKAEELNIQFEVIESAFSMVETSKDDFPFNFSTSEMAVPHTIAQTGRAGFIGKLSLLEAPNDARH